MSRYSAYIFAAIIWTAMTVSFSWLFINPFLGDEEWYRELTSDGVLFALGRACRILLFAGISTSLLALGARLEKVARYRIVLLWHFAAMVAGCAMSAVLFYLKFS